MAKIADDLSIEGRLIFSSGTTQRAFTFPEGTGTLMAISGNHTSGQLFISNGVSILPYTLNYSNDTFATGLLPINQGGTSQNTANKAFNALSPLNAKGGVIGFDGSVSVGVASGSDKSFLMSDASASAGIAFKNPVQWVVTTGNTTDNIGNFKDAAGLSFFLESNKDYMFEFNVIIRSTSGANGAGLSINGPSSPRHIVYMREIPVSAATAGTDNMNVQMGSGYNDTGSNTSTIDHSNVNKLAFVKGVIGTSATSGDLVVRFRTETAGSTITVASGSCGFLYKLN